MLMRHYQKLAERTSATKTSEGRDACRHRLVHHRREIRLLHGVMGLCTEAGEAQDQLKRVIFYGADLDVVNLAEEVGDVLWYCAEILNALDVDMSDVMEKNIAKLRARFPDKFTEGDALNRDLDEEREALE